MEDNPIEHGHCRHRYDACAESSHLPRLRVRQFERALPLSGYWLNSPTDAIFRRDKPHPGVRHISNRSSAEDCEVIFPAELRRFERVPRGQHFSGERMFEFGPAPFLRNPLGEPKKMLGDFSRAGVAIYAKRAVVITVPRPKDTFDIDRRGGPNEGRIPAGDLDQAM